jgi:hypothetical protein
MCQFEIKTLAAAVLALLSMSLTAGAIAKSTNWYTVC